MRSESFLNIHLFAGRLFKIGCDGSTGHTNRVSSKQPTENNEVP
jgi:hypothetical protein